MIEIVPYNSRWPQDFERLATVAAAYAELKRRLAASLANPKDYPEVKDPALDLIYLAAQAWADTRSWPGGDNGPVSESGATREAAPFID